MKEQKSGLNSKEIQNERIGLNQEFSLFHPNHTGSWRNFYSSHVILQLDAVQEIYFDINAILNFTNRGNCIDILSGKIVRGYLDPRLVLSGDITEGIDSEVVKRLRIQLAVGDFKFISSLPNFCHEGTLQFAQFESEFSVEGDKDDYHDSHHGLILPQTAHEAQGIKAEFVLDKS